MQGMQGHRLAITAFGLMLKVKATGGEFRTWQGVRPCFMWFDRAGNTIAGWEDDTSRGTVCVVYRGCRTISDAPIVRRLPVRANRPIG